MHLLRFFSLFKNPLLFCLIPICGGTIGCAGPISEPTEPAPFELAEQLSKVVVNAPGRADNGELVCYIGETIRRYESEDLRLTRVYDLSFFTIGFYLNDGATYRLIESKDGEFQEKFLGNHEIETCLSRITGTEGPFRIERGI